MRNLKKSLALLAAVLCLGGCGPMRLGQLNMETATEEKLAREMSDRFTAALDAGDIAALKGMFSVNVQNIEGLDEQLQRLTEFYAGPTDAVGFDNVKSSSGSNDHGVKTASVRYEIPLRSGDDYYWCYIDLTYRDDADPDNVGINRLIFFSGGDYRFLRNSGDFTYPAEPGVHLYFDRRDEGDIRCVDGSDYLFENQTPPLDEAEVKAFLDGNRSLAAFKAGFGEPNAVDGREFVYLLPDEDGEYRYLVVVAESDNADAIRSVRVVGEFDRVRVLWNIE